MTDRNEAVEALTETEVKRLETQVQQEVEKEARDEVRKRYKEQFRRQMRQQTGADEPLEEVYIDLAKHADCIMIDGVKYLHGTRRTVRASVAALIREIMQAGHYHQAEIDGKPKRYYTERATTISPHGNVSTSQLLRV